MILPGGWKLKPEHQKIASLFAYNQISVQAH